MCLVISLLLLVAAIISILLKRQTQALIISIVNLIVFFAVGCGPVASILLKVVQPDVSPEQIKWSDRNVIVALGVGVEKLPDQTLEPSILAYGRIAKSIDVYRRCKETSHQCYLLFSGGDPQQRGSSEADVYSRMAIASGVDPSAILKESKSANTWQNAMYSRGIVDSLKPDAIILVTSAIHMKRSVLYFSHFGMHVQPIHADYIGAIHSYLPLSYNFFAADAALHEITSLFQFRFYNAFGLNRSQGSAGSF